MSSAFSEDWSSKDAEVDSVLSSLADFKAQAMAAIEYARTTSDHLLGSTQAHASDGSSVPPAGGENVPLRDNVPKSRGGGLSAQTLNKFLAGAIKSREGLPTFRAPSPQASSADAPQRATSPSLATRASPPRHRPHREDERILGREIDLAEQRRAPPAEQDEPEFEDTFDAEPEPPRRDKGNKVTSAPRGGLDFSAHSALRGPSRASRVPDSPASVLYGPPPTAAPAPTPAFVSRRGPAPDRYGHDAVDNASAVAHAESEEDESLMVNTRLVRISEVPFDPSPARGQLSFGQPAPVTRLSQEGDAERLLSPIKRQLESLKRNTEVQEEVNAAGMRALKERYDAEIGRLHEMTNRLSVAAAVAAISPPAPAPAPAPAPPPAAPAPTPPPPPPPPVQPVPIPQYIPAPQTVYLQAHPGAFPYAVAMAPRPRHPRPRPSRPRARAPAGPASTPAPAPRTDRAIATFHDAGQQTTAAENAWPTPLPSPPAPAAPPSHGATPARTSSAWEAAPAPEQYWRAQQQAPSGIEEIVDGDVVIRAPRRRPQPPSTGVSRRLPRPRPSFARSSPRPSRGRAPPPPARAAGFADGPLQVGQLEQELARGRAQQERALQERDREEQAALSGRRGLEEKLEEAEGQQKRAVAAIRQLSLENDALRRDLHGAREKAAAGERDTGKLKEQIEVLRDELQAAVRREKEAAGAADRLAKECNMLRIKLDGATKGLQDERAAHAETRGQLNEARRELRHAASAAAAAPEPRPQHIEARPQHAEARGRSHAASAAPAPRALSHGPAAAGARRPRPLQGLVARPSTARGQQTSFNLFTGSDAGSVHGHHERERDRSPPLRAMAWDEPPSPEPEPPRPPRIDPLEHGLPSQEELEAILEVYQKFKHAGPPKLAEEQPRSRHHSSRHLSEPPSAPEPPPAPRPAPPPAAAAAAAPAAPAGRREGEIVPFAVDGPRTRDELQFNSLEKTLMGLCVEKDRLEAEYARLPSTAGKTAEQRRRKKELESRLETLGSEISTVRRIMRESGYL
eukprot:tig00000076_g2379.t2